MKKWLGVAMAAMALQAGMPAAQAARASASMDVSFRVVETCAIRTAATGQDAEVRCQYQTPYQVQARAQAPGAAEAPRRAERPADADAPAALTIWF